MEPLVVVLIVIGVGLVAFVMALDALGLLG